MDPDRQKQYEDRAKALGDEMRHTLDREFPEVETTVKATPKLRKMPKVAPVTSNPTKPQVMRDGSKN